MPDVPGAVPARPKVPRRRLISLIAGGALTGAIWTTGLTVLARGTHPQVFVLGDDAWHVLLLEHGTNRIAMLVGTFDQSPELEIDRLCGLLRQHIDVVIGDGEALGLLSSSFRERRTVSTIIQVDAGTSMATSANYIPLSKPVRIQAGSLDLELAHLDRERWMNGAERDPTWIAHLTIGDLTIAVAPALETIAEHGDIRSTLAISPVGDIDCLWRTLPGITVATNTREAFETLASGPPTTVRRRLVRTFDRDIAAFVARDGQLRLPGWTQDSSPSGTLD